MKKSSTGIRLSASDLSNHLSCRHLTTLDMDVAMGSKAAPVWNSPNAQILQERGIAHEDAYVEHLKSTGLAAVNFRAFGNDDKLVGETLLAMQAAPTSSFRAPLEIRIGLGGSMSCESRQAFQARQLVV